MTLTLYLRITGPARRGESFTVEAERVRIGTAAHCEVRLPLGDAAPVHVVLEDGGAAGLLAEAFAESPRVTIDGQPLTRGILAADAVLQIGNTKIQASVAGGVAQGARPAAPKKSSPLAYLAAALAIPLGVTQLTLTPKDDEMTPSRTVPALFASAGVSCAQPEPASALALGSEQLERANGKRERRPFHAYDGVRAVGLYRAAAACFRAAADVPQAERAESAAAALERDLDESYRTHRVRLEHALLTKSYELARAEVRALRDLTHGASGEYVNWLGGLERRLALRAGKKR